MGRRWAVRTAGLASACLLASGCTFSTLSDDPQNLVKDKEGLALNVHRLSVAVEDLNAVTDPRHAHAKEPARSSGCSVDDGEVFEPSASREWMLTGPARDNTDPYSVDAEPLKASALGQRAMERIAAQLIARGWSGTGQVVHRQDIYFLDLKRVHDDHRVVLGMQGFSDSILVTASTTPRHVCDHSP